MKIEKNTKQKKGVFFIKVCKNYCEKRLEKNFLGMKYKRRSRTIIRKIFEIFEGGKHSCTH